MVGELFTDIIEDEGVYHCWRCLSIHQQTDMKKSKPRVQVGV
jgi:hypothetical protein